MRRWRGKQRKQTNCFSFPFVVVGGRARAECLQSKHAPKVYVFVFFQLWGKKKNRKFVLLFARMEMIHRAMQQKRHLAFFFSFLFFLLNQRLFERAKTLIDFHIGLCRRCRRSCHLVLRKSRFSFFSFFQRYKMAPPPPPSQLQELFFYCFLLEQKRVPADRR